MDAIIRAHECKVRMIDSSIVRVHPQGATKKRGIDIVVWAAPETASRPKSMRSSTSKVGQSS